MDETGEQPKEGISKGIIVIILVVIIVLAAGVYEFTKTKSATTMTPSPTASEIATPTVAASQSETSVYKDGTYASTGDYLSPGGEEQVDVSLTLKNGVVEDVTFTPKATRPNSVKFQGKFASGYKNLVVGKNIDEVKLDVVSGSSLTPKGFNDALEKIKEDAKA
ncbi:MAG: FMN-binding protein [Candidatus Levybacteria bacterium]|nr:FMN-binding protein [Candidatus Levybacteria bacterium]